MNRFLTLGLFTSLVLLTSASLFAQGLVSDKEAMEGAFPPRPYSPPAGRDFPMKVLWGDTP